MVCGGNFLKIVTRFDGIHSVTDGRTPHDGTGRACIASRQNWSDLLKEVGKFKFGMHI